MNNSPRISNDAALEEITKVGIRVAGRRVAADTNWENDALFARETSNRTIGVLHACHTAVVSCRLLRKDSWLDSARDLERVECGAVDGSDDVLGAASGVVCCGRSSEG